MLETRGLSEREKSCLRLVSQGLTSKEIAIRLETTPGVIDNYITSAVRILQASSRRQAARILMERELEPVQQLHVQPAALVTRSEPDELNAPETDAYRIDEAAVSGSPSTPFKRLLRFSTKLAAIAIDHVGGSRHGWTKRQILLAIMLAALLSTALLAAITAVYYWMNFIFS